MALLLLTYLTSSLPTFQFVVSDPLTLTYCLFPAVILPSAPVVLGLLAPVSGILYLITLELLTHTHLLGHI